MILDKKISYFKNTKATECVNESKTIKDFLNHFKNGEYKDIIDKVRSAKNKDDKSYWKLKLPSIAFHGIFNGWRKKEDFSEASGLVILDHNIVDKDNEEIKQDIMDGSDNVLAVMTSPSGNGIKILCYVTPEIINADNYRSIGKQLISEFSIYGKVDFLSVTDTLIATYDPNILINEEAIPNFVYVKDQIKEIVELEPVDKNKTLWDDVEDFYETVLWENIAKKTNNNFHYIQVAVLDLAKFGFKSPEHDLSFVVDYAESEFKHSSKNQDRLKQVCEIAKDLPQKKWAYKLIESDEPDEGYVDYSEYQDDLPMEGEQNVEGEIEDDGFINYETFFEKVLETIKEGDRVGFEISYEELADILRFKGSGIFTLTGIPGHGKTEMLDAITLDLVRLYGHQVLIAGFEQSPEEHIIKLIRKLEGADIRSKTYINNELNLLRIKKLYNFVVSKFIHIDTNKTGGNITSILDGFARKIVELRKQGGDPKYVVIDPFNMLSIKGKFSGHEKIEEILRRITHFSHQMNILVFLVAHPFKMKKDEKTGIYEVPDFYSVKGSSSFFEMSYHGAVVYRTSFNVMVRILKVKQNNLGTKDEEAFFLYEKNSGRYIPCDEDGNEKSGTHRDFDWLEKAIELENNNYKTIN